MNGRVHSDLFEKVEETLCESNLRGLIQTDDGATIQFDALGFFRRPTQPGDNIWVNASAVTFHTDDDCYAWLNGLCCKNSGVRYLLCFSCFPKGGFMENPFKWRHYESAIILLCVRWYLRYALSYRDLEEMMSERGLAVVHTTIYRWVQAYAPEIDRRCRPYWKRTNDSWRVDETYVKVRGKWLYLYRALDSEGNTLDFLLNATRNRRAAKRFFRKVLGGKHVTSPRVINVDKNPATIGAVRDLKREQLLPEKCKRRLSQSMNNIIEQDHHFLKQRMRPGLGFFSYPTTWRTIRGYEAMHMIRKGQVRGADKGDISAQNQFIAGLFGLVC